MLLGEHKIQKVSNGLTLNIRTSEGFSKFAFFEQGKGSGHRVTDLLVWYRKMAAGLQWVN